MNRFVHLWEGLQGAASDAEQADRLHRYFTSATPTDRNWALRLLLHPPPRRLIDPTLLLRWAQQAAQLPDWLMAVSTAEVDDPAEAAALLVPRPPAPVNLRLGELLEQRTLPLNLMAPEEQQQSILQTWMQLEPAARWLWNKMLLGSFRPRMQRRIVARALALTVDVSPFAVTERLEDESFPGAETDWFAHLTQPCSAEDSRRWPKPHPKAERWDEALPLAAGTTTPEPGHLQRRLVDPAEWRWEWLPEGRAAQVVRHGTGVSLWSAEGERLNSEFPSVAWAAQFLPEGVTLAGHLRRGDADTETFQIGDLLGSPSSQPHLETLEARLRFAQARLEEASARWNGQPEPQCEPSSTWQQSELFGEERPSATAQKKWPFVIASELPITTVEDIVRARKSARDQGHRGLRFRRRRTPSPPADEPEGGWEWPNDPLLCQAVLLSVQDTEAGREYHFGVRDTSAWIRLATVTAAPTSEDVERVKRLLKDNMEARYGSTRLIKPSLVVLLAYERLVESRRHKAGCRLQDPRWVRSLPDLTPEDVPGLVQLRDLAKSADQSSMARTVVSERIRE